MSRYRSVYGIVELIKYFDQITWTQWIDNLCLRFEQKNMELSQHTIVMCGKLDDWIVRMIYHTLIYVHVVVLLDRIAIAEAHTIITIVVCAEKFGN